MMNFPKHQRRCKVFNNDEKIKLYFYTSIPIKPSLDNDIKIFE